MIKKKLWLPFSRTKNSLYNMGLVNALYIELYEVFSVSLYIVFDSGKIVYIR